MPLKELEINELCKDLSGLGDSDKYQIVEAILPDVLTAMSLKKVEYNNEGPLAKMILISQQGRTYHQQWERVFAEKKVLVGVLKAILVSFNGVAEKLPVLKNIYLNLPKKQDGSVRIMPLLMQAVQELTIGKSDGVIASLKDVWEGFDASALQDINFDELLPLVEQTGVDLSAYQQIPALLETIIPQKPTV